MKVLGLAALMLVLATTACARQGSDPASQHLKDQCTLDGVSLPSPDDTRVVTQLAKDCHPIGVCTLACLRSGCDQGLGRNCLHTCSPTASDKELAAAALEFSTKRHAMCSSGPNKSFKPNPLRGSA
jgi:hypothetical protein